MEGAEKKSLTSILLHSFQISFDFAFGDRCLVYCWWNTNHVPNTRLPLLCGLSSTAQIVVQRPYVSLAIWPQNNNKMIYKVWENLTASRTGSSQSDTGLILANYCWPYLQCFGAAVRFYAKKQSLSLVCYGWSPQDFILLGVRVDTIQRNTTN